MDSLGYLRRFIDIDYSLPLPNRGDYCKLLIKKYRLANSSEWFWFFLSECINAFDYSLRDIEKLFNYISLFLPSTEIFDDNNKSYKPSSSNQCYTICLSILYSLLICIKVKEPKIYNEILNKDYNIEDMREKFRIITIINSINLSSRENFNNKLFSELFSDSVNAFLSRYKTSFSARSSIFKIGANIQDYKQYALNINVFWDKEECKLIRKLSFLDDFNLQV